MLIGGGARSAAYRQVVADLTGRVVLVPDADEVVARGAAVQAAAVLTGRRIDDIARAWELGRAISVDPDPSVDGGAVRAAYARALQEVGPDDR
jgi:xylulokinase